MIAIFAGGASYSDDFSTVLRTTRMAELSVEVRDEHLDGKSPLPASLREATARMRQEDTISKKATVRLLSDGES